MTRKFTFSSRAFALCAGLALSASPLAACVGTSTGNPAQDTPDGGSSKHGDAGTLTNGGEGGLYAQCKATSSNLAALDTKSPLGFSANDVLALIGGDHTVSMEWLSDDTLKLTPAPGESTLHIGITARDTKPRFVKLDMRDGGVGSETLGLLMPAGDACPDRIDVDVHVTLKSDDGGLDEAFDTTVAAPSTKSVTITQTIDAKDLGGSLNVEPQGALLGFTLRSLFLQTSFSELGIAGSLSPTFVSQTTSGSNSGSGSSTSTGAGGVAAAGGGIARWPAGHACDAFSSFGIRGVPRAIDQALGKTSVKDAIALVNGEGTLTLGWQHAASTSLQVEFTADGDTACASFGASVFGTADQNAQISILGKLTAKSADGRIDASWPLTLTAYFTAADALDHVAIAPDPNGGIIDGLVAASDFVGTYGIKGIDLTGYDQANAIFDVSWSADGATAPTGSLTVQGAHTPMCASEKPQQTMSPDGGSSGGSSSSPGCAGLDLQKLEEASLLGK